MIWFGLNKDIWIDICIVLVIKESLKGFVEKGSFCVDLYYCFMGVEFLILLLC